MRYVGVVATRTAGFWVSETLPRAVALYPSTPGVELPARYTVARYNQPLLASAMAPYKFEVAVYNATGLEATVSPIKFWYTPLPPCRMKGW